MARPYLSDPIEATWVQPEHETFVTLAERIDDYLNEPTRDEMADLDQQCGICGARWNSTKNPEGDHHCEPVWCDGCNGWCVEGY